MTYTIRIKKTATVTKTRGREWRVIGKKANGDDEFGYTPAIEVEVEEETMIYKQTVDDLDLQAVIAAVNGEAK